MKKKESAWRARWRESPWKELQAGMERGIAKRKKNLLDGLQFTITEEDRVDLRGITLKLRTMLRGSNIGNLDLRQATIKFFNLDGATVGNCLFDEAEFLHYNDWKSLITHCSFREAQFHDAGFGLREARYEFCDFPQADFSEASFDSGSFRDCDFSQAKLDGGRFRGIQFQRCRFAGKIRGVMFFNGNTTAAQERQRGQIPPNRMLECDFSDAILEDVCFRRGVDLSTAKWPSDGNHFLFLNWPATLEASRKEVLETVMSDDMRQRLLEMLEAYICPADLGQVHYVVNRDDLVRMDTSEGFDGEAGKILLEILLKHRERKD